MATKTKKTTKQSFTSPRFYDTQKNEAVWEPFKTEIDAIKVMKGEMEMKEIVAHFKDEFSDILKLVGSAVSYKEGSLLWNLTLDNEGNSYNPNIAPANGLPKDASGNVMDVSYGAFGPLRRFDLQSGLAYVTRKECGGA